MVAEQGKFITVEGQDGAGKSTNIEIIEAVLQQHNIEYVHTREPGGTELGEKLRALLLNDSDAMIGDTAELLIIFAARAQHLDEVIKPALAAGKWVLCDRFTDATYAYQGGGRGLDVKTISALETLVQGDLRPDLTVLLDVPVSVGEERADNRGEPDRFEQQQQSFKQRVRACYLARAKEEPARFSIVDASLALAQVQAQVEQVLVDYIQRVRPPL